MVTPSGKPALDRHAWSLDRLRRYPVYWFNKANELRSAAGALWACGHDKDATSAASTLCGESQFWFSQPVYHMLCGMALELLLKAIIVAEGKEPSEIHDLVALHHTVGLKPTKQQVGLLRILTESIVWVGRYPTPTKKNVKQYAEYMQLWSEHLNDNSGTGTLNILRPNRNLEWDSFSEVWSPLATIYWQYQTPASGVPPAN